MATKGMAIVDSTGSLSLAQLPPQISLTSSILASIVRLPPDPLIAYTIFQPSDTLDTSHHLSAVESARRSLVSDSRSILKSLLFTVKVLPRFPLLYVFAISSSDQRSPPHDTLLNLNFDGLVCMFPPSIPPGFSPHPLFILLPQPLPVLPFLSRDFTHAALPARPQTTRVQGV
jgi:mediator of RNA polymerase II transcription subunit 13, fungi type